ERAAAPGPERVAPAAVRLLGELEIDLDVDVLADETRVVPALADVVVEAVDRHLADEACRGALRLPRERELRRIRLALQRELAVRDEPVGGLLDALRLEARLRMLRRIEPVGVLQRRVPIEVTRADGLRLHDADDAAGRRVIRIKVDRRVELLEAAVVARALLNESELDGARLLGDFPFAGRSAERGETRADADEHAEMSNLVHPPRP